jgi:UDP-N-acetylmuramoylalanine--D-glutamate ligase
VNQKPLTLIIGLGKTGLSVARFLNDKGVAFIACDSRQQIPNIEQVSELTHCQAVLASGFAELDNELLGQINQVVISPGVAPKGELFEQLANAGLELIGDIELFAHWATKPVIAITGSNGKSTVTELTGLLIAAAGYKVAVGGNIGTPALELLNQDVDFYVLELSSFQLETCKSLAPIVATVLNISADHMDRYPSFDAYAQTKLQLLKLAKASVLPSHVAAEYQLEVEQLVTIEDVTDANVNSDIHCTYYRASESQSLMADTRELVKLADLKLVGSHNYLNVLVAIGLCEQAGIKFTENMRQKLCAWHGLAHRCEFIATIDGVHCYNDSKATNVGATVAAIEGLRERYAGKLLLIAGGDGKGADFSPLRALFNTTLKALFLIGLDAEKMLEQAGSDINSMLCQTMDNAVAKAFEIAKAGDAILLSPACASLDMYSNFEARGEHFKQLVEARL